MGPLVLISPPGDRAAKNRTKNRKFTSQYACCQCIKLFPNSLQCTLFALPSNQMKETFLRSRIAKSVGARRGEVVLRRDFEGWASPSQVTRALQGLLSRGQLVRLGYGVYAKGRPSRLSGKPVPRQPLEALAFEALDRLGIAAAPGEAGRGYA